VRTFSGGFYEPTHPLFMIFDGTHVWVTNYFNSLTSIQAG